MLLPLKPKLEAVSRRRSRELCAPHQRYWALFLPVDLSKKPILLVMVSFAVASLAFYPGHQHSYKQGCSNWILAWFYGYGLQLLEPLLTSNDYNYWKMTKLQIVLQVEVFWIGFNVNMQHALASFPGSHAWAQEPGNEAKHALATCLEQHIVNGSVLSLPVL